MLKSIVACLVTVALLVVVNRSSQAEDERILSYEAALDDYLGQASFHCRYTLKEGTAKSFSDAMSGRFASVDWTARGSMSRLKEKLRFSIDFGRPALVVGPRLRANLSTDSMTNGRIVVWHELKYGNEGNYANVGRARSSEENRVPSDGRCMHPLNLFGGVPGNPLLRPSGGFADKPFERQMLDDSELTARIETVYRDGNTAVRKIVAIDRRPSQPLVTSIYQTGEVSGVANAFAEVRATDFVQLGPVEIPRTIRLAMGNSANGTCIAREWKATEVRFPEKHDFVMQLASGTRVNGFKKAVDNRMGLALDLDRISPEMLEDGSAVMAALGITGSPVEGRAWFWWVGGLLAVVLIAITLWWWRMRYAL